MGRALGAQRAFADGVVRVALGADELAVLDEHDDVAAAGAVGADGHHLFGYDISLCAKAGIDF